MPSLGVQCGHSSLTTNLVNKCRHFLPKVSPKRLRFVRIHLSFEVISLLDLDAFLSADPHRNAH